jgi:hypothetical protein
VVQLSVLALSAVVAYQMKLGKNGRIVGYGYPLTATGTVVLVVGMLICSHVVDQCTVEDVWKFHHVDGEPSGGKDLNLKDIRNGYGKIETLGPRLLWLQRGDCIGDQHFSSFGIFGSGARDSILTSRRGDSCAVNFQHAGFSGCCHPLRLLKLNLKSSEYLQILVVLGTLASVCGFIIQFVGLRSMHWSASIAQLVATFDHGLCKSFCSTAHRSSSFHHRRSGRAWA